MEHWKLHFIDCKNHFKVRRTGAIAIGVGAATAVVLSVVGAKTPVVIGSAAALGIAGGVVAGRKGREKNAEKCLESFKLKMAEEDYQGAIADLNKAIEIDSQIAVLFYNRGGVKDNLGDHKGAIDDYTKAIEIDPHYVDSYNDRGLSKEELGDHKGAIDDYTKAIEIAPEHGDAYFNRGTHKTNYKHYLSYYESIDYRGAIADFTKAIEIDPLLTDAYTNRAYAKDNLRDFYYWNSCINSCWAKGLAKVIK